MGGGTYSSVDRNIRASAMGYHTKSRHEIFESGSLDEEMNPKDVMLREARDSEEHPESLAIIVALDETGSMGTIPHELVKDGLPSMINNIFKGGIEHPQVMFMGVGDHKVDSAPLQIGQFESSDELLDKWLTKIYLEGNGGGNGGESYHLPWYFAAFRTEIDCLEKRGQKGFLFTIGDEPIHDGITANSLKSILGKGEYKDFSAAALFEEASKKYHVYHIHIKESYSNSGLEEGWRNLIGENFLVAKTKKDVPKLISKMIVEDKKTKMISPANQPATELIL
jgi:hypothetical protein